MMGPNQRPPDATHEGSGRLPKGLDRTGAFHRIENDKRSRIRKRIAVERIVGYSYKAGGSDVCALYESRGTRARLPESATTTGVRILY